MNYTGCVKQNKNEVESWNAQKQGILILKKNNIPVLDICRGKKNDYKILIRIMENQSKFLETEKGIYLTACYFKSQDWHTRHSFIFEMKIVKSTAAKILNVIVQILHI